MSAWHLLVFIGAPALFVVVLFGLAVLYGNWIERKQSKDGK